jgi:potassium-transporting ATPase KdpC subunit
VKNHIVISIRITVVLLVITCGLYPAVVWGIGQVAFRDKANGSLIARGGRVIGSELIGQEFASDRYFHVRPPGVSNLGPTSRKLRDTVAKAVQSYDMKTNVPADAATASASGLDPHISPDNALAQAARVAKARRMDENRLRALVRDHVEGRFLGIYGEPRVNVLLLNLALDELTSAPRS